MIDLNIHNIKKIEVGQIKNNTIKDSGRKYSIRYLTITTEKNERVMFSFFGETEKDLKIIETKEQ